MARGLTFALSTPIFVACSAGSQDLGSNEADGGVEPVGAASGATFSQVSGKLDGKTFVPKSGSSKQITIPKSTTGTEDIESINLEFSDVAVDLCEQRANWNGSSGQILVTAYGLRRDDATGTYQGVPHFNTLRALRIPSCATGETVNFSQIAAFTTYTIRVDDPTSDPMVGEFHAVLDDGSKLDFSFSVPVCGRPADTSWVKCQ